jgi:hypothetical protein
MNMEGLEYAFVKTDNYGRPTAFLRICGEGDEEIVFIDGWLCYCDSQEATLDVWLVRAQGAVYELQCRRLDFEAAEETKNKMWTATRCS